MPPIFRPLRHRGFAFLWLSHNLATLGSAGASIATAWQVLSMRGSAVDLGVLVGINAVANMLCLPAGGLVADRFPRERILLAIAVLSALSSFGIALLLSFDLLQIWHLYALSAWFGAVVAFHAPARQAIYPTLLPREELLRANGLRSASVHLIGLVGAGLGGLLVDVWGTAGAFTFQGALGAVSAVFLLGVRPAFPFPQQAYQPWLRRLNEGVAAIRATTWVWGTILLSVAGTAVAAGALSVVIPLYIKEDLGLSATVLGTLNSAGAAGALVVAVLIGQARALPRGGVPAYAGVAVAGASVIAYAFLTTPATLLSASAIGWGGLAVFTLTWNTALQRRIPSQLLGRVAGVDGFASLLLVPAAVPLMGVATEALGAPTVMVAGGAVIIALAVVAAAVPVMRRWG